VGKLTILLDTFNSLTGVTRRHNQALRDVTDWSVTIQEFLSRYNLQEGSSNLESIFENIGPAKLDVTNITYRTRAIIKAAKDITGKKIVPLLEEVYNDLEEVRRGIFTPKLGSVFLRKSVAKLHKSFKNLREAISGMEFK